MTGLRCYCCGEEVGDEFSLGYMGEDGVDRVFIVKTEHTDRIDAGVTFVPVGRKEVP